MRKLDLDVIVIRPLVQGVAHLGKRKSRRSPRFGVRTL
jgi:hypothetical protein